MAERPRGTVHATFVRGAGLKGAYRWLERPAVEWANVADALHLACAHRCRPYDRILVAIDGSSLAHTDTAGAHGVGRIGSDRAGARGLKSMIALAMTLDGIPLGIASHVLWARGETATVPHAKRALADKESHWWTTLQTRTESTLARVGASTQCWYQLDGEADAKHVLVRGLRPKHLFTTRAHHDRLLTAQKSKRAHLALHAALESTPPCAQTSLFVPRDHDRRARVAQVELVVAHVGVKLRAQWSHRKLADVPLTAVLAREVSPAPGVESLRWLLLTSYPVNSGADALEVLRAYALRFRIEAVHQTWKSSGCDAEASELRSLGALTKWATLQLAVAVEIQHTLHRSRTEPDLPAEQVFSQTELRAAQTLANAERITKAPAVGTKMTLANAVALIARLGGYSARSNEGPPGPTTFKRGYERVVTAALVLEFRSNRRTKRRPPEPSG